MDSFALWIAQDGDWAVVYQAEPAEAVRELLGEKLRRLEFRLKSPIRHGSQREANRMLWVADPILGMQKDESLRPAAECLAFLEPWPLEAPFTLEGFDGLHPLVAGALHAAVMARVYPNPLDTPFFAVWRSRPATSPEAGSPASGE